MNKPRKSHERQKLRLQVAELMSSQFGISENISNELFDVGFFREDLARRVLIKYEYLSRCMHGNKTLVKEDLSKKYGVCFSTIEKYIFSEAPMSTK